MQYNEVNGYYYCDPFKRKFSTYQVKPIKRFLLEKNHGIWHNATYAYFHDADHDETVKYYY